MVKNWWASTNKMTVFVASRDGIIVEAAPIIRRFMGQPLRDLKAWLIKQGGLRIERLP